MIVLYLLMLVGCFILYLKSNNKKKLFSEAIAEYLYEQKPELFIRRQMREKIQMLSAGEKKESSAKQHAIEKLSLAVLMLTLTSVLAIFLTISNCFGGSLEDENWIVRNGHGQGKKEIILRTVLEEQEVQIPFLVEEQKYTKEELEVLYLKYVEELEIKILGGNSSVDSVKQDMEFLTSLPGYPFQNQWECSDYLVLSQEGNIKEEVESQEGILVKVTVTISYFDWRREYSFFVKVFEKELLPIEMVEKRLKKELIKRDSGKKEEKKFLLPASWEGQELKWSEKKEDSAIAVFLVGIIAAICSYFFKEQEITKQVKQRQEEMLMDYPEIISKLTLFMGAGMSVRKTIEKLATEYQKKKKEDKKYAYEELCALYQEMERGISEIQAYENFGKRCKVPVYMKLGTLLAQNVKKGNSSLLKMLQNEAKDAFEERKNRAKKKGEEAGTKLLLPMMLMLMIVMIIVVVPAFFSFQI